MDSLRWASDRARGRHRGPEGDIVRVARADDSLFRIGEPSADPALFTNWDDAMMQFRYPTCAKLYNYHDVEGSRKDGRARGRGGLPGGLRRSLHDPDSRRIPVLAAVEPAVTAGTMAAPLSGLSPNFIPITPSTVRESRRCEGVRRGQSAAHLRAVRRGRRARHQAGNPAPDLHVRSRFPCTVQSRGDAGVPHGLETPIASDHLLPRRAHRGRAVLKRNPNYGGTARSTSTRSLYEFGIAPAAAAARIEDGTLD